MKLALIFAALLMVAWIDAPMPQAQATPKDYREVLKMLRGIEDSLQELSRSKDGEKPDCRGLSPEKTVRCAAEAFDTDVDQALSVWRCESNFGTESPHSDPYHGPFQYLLSTYQSQQNSMPDVMVWYELSRDVHDMRSNILTAVAYAARHGWGPWGCA